MQTQTRWHNLLFDLAVPVDGTNCLLSIFSTSLSLSDPWNKKQEYIGEYFLHNLHVCCSCNWCAYFRAHTAVRISKLVWESFSRPPVGVEGCLHLKVLRGREGWRYRLDNFPNQGKIVVCKDGILNKLWTLVVGCLWSSSSVESWTESVVGHFSCMRWMDVSQVFDCLSGSRNHSSRSQSNLCRK